MRCYSSMQQTANANSCQRRLELSKGLPIKKPSKLAIHTSSATARCAARAACRPRLVRGLTGGITACRSAPSLPESPRLQPKRHHNRDPEPVGSFTPGLLHIGLRCCIHHRHIMIHSLVDDLASLGSFLWCEGSDRRVCVCPSEFEFLVFRVL